MFACAYGAGLLSYRHACTPAPGVPPVLQRHCAPPSALFPHGSQLPLCPSVAEVEANGNEGAVFLREFTLIRRDDLPEESSPEDTGSSKPDDSVRPLLLLLAPQLPAYPSVRAAVVSLYCRSNCGVFASFRVATHHSAVPGKC
ncbi:hypothetical protein COCON_G00115230 [Conger conger]|uniref:Uncharacterized protein n=1 Tax=Conger conger TaxID=82655 RepID=A0A9Q1HY33_CONCO|nr:hypothetical protein COCON_G00115230 [Conger conger]